VLTINLATVFVYISLLMTVKQKANNISPSGNSTGKSKQNEVPKNIMPFLGDSLKGSKNKRKYT
jgi:hypothetical protein